VRRALASLLVLAVVAGCSGSDSSGSASKPQGASASSKKPAVEAELYTADDFYTPPDPLPEGDHGTLLRYEPIAGYDVAGAKAWRVMYLSESVAGDPVAVTGSVLVPTAAAPSGGRKLVTIAHGTTGIADECAPSRDPRASELTLATASFVPADYVVAMSDYEGLGTPGRHPYLVGDSEGRSVLDAATAAEELPHADVGDKYAIIGYSQGGHGALFAGQLAKKWGPPGLDLVGTVAGAPATELPTIFAAGGSGIVSGFVFMIIAGLHAAYPAADLAKLVTPAGETALDDVDHGCTGQVLASIAGKAAAGPLLKPGYLQAEPWADLADENTPGHAVTDTPILILHSKQDNVVPAALSEALFRRMCGEGQVVERRVYDKGQGHVAAAPGAYADGFAWIQGLMAGTTHAKSTCP
jgi:pimeloyl-ACP methyl ester carboxylesterase